MKITFENEWAAKVFLKKAPRLAADNLLGHIHIKKDESLAERQRKWSNRQENMTREAGQGSGMQGTQYVPSLDTPNRQSGGGAEHATEERTPVDQNVAHSVPIETGDTTGDGPWTQSEESGSESDGDSYVTLDELTDTEDESESSQEEDQSWGEATLAEAFAVMGVGVGTERWDRLREGSITAAINRLHEATNMIAAERNTLSGNERRRERTVAD